MAKKPLVQPSQNDAPQKSSSSGTLKSMLMKKPSKKPAPLEVEEGLISGVTESMNFQSTHGDGHARIAQRAYELFQGRGGHPGQDLDDWLAAEQEILAKDLSS
jgi:DUF2934 family protein